MFLFHFPTPARVLYLSPILPQTARGVRSFSLLHCSVCSNQQRPNSRPTCSLQEGVGNVRSEQREVSNWRVTSWRQEYLSTAAFGAAEYFQHFLSLILCFHYRSSFTDNTKLVSRAQLQTQLFLWSSHRQVHSSLSYTHALKPAVFTLSFLRHCLQTSPHPPPAHQSLS